MFTMTFAKTSDRQVRAMINAMELLILPPPPRSAMYIRTTVINVNNIVLMSYREVYSSYILRVYRNYRTLMHGMR